MLISTIASGHFKKKRHETRRPSSCIWSAGAAASPAVSPWAQTYPTRPVHLVVGFPPGGGTDITARLLGQWLSERLGQQFVIENRPGAGSNIATEESCACGCRWLHPPLGKCGTCD